MRRIFLVSICLLSVIGLGCGEPPIDLTPLTSPRLDASGMAPSLVDSGQTPAPDMGMTAMLHPDEERFALDVLRILEDQCSACHLGTINPDNNGIRGGNAYEFSPEDIQGSIAEILHPSFSSPDSPANSTVIVHHEGTSRDYQTQEDKDVVTDWIADTTVPKGAALTNMD